MKKYILPVIAIVFLAVGCSNEVSNETAEQSNTALQTTYTMSDVQAANSDAKCYSVVNGSVYDLTSWIGKHEGGKQAIESICGKDGSSAFNQQHEGERKPDKELAKYKIGILQK